MMINYICSYLTKGDSNVIRRSESILQDQPNRPKDKLGMFNYWSEKKRSNVSDESTTSRLILDFDDDIPRSEAEELYKDYSYVIYNSTGNDSKNGISKFRMIFELKEPVDAQSLKHWRMKLWKDMFDKADYSTFSIGRFFYVPSKFDKGGDAVTISHHSGMPFDFYAKYPHYSSNVMFDKIRQKMLSKPYEFSWDNISDEKFAENCRKLQQYIVTNGFTHYAFIPHVVGKARFLHIDFNTAYGIFTECYEGKSECEKYFRNLWEKV